MISARARFVVARTQASSGSVIFFKFFAIEGERKNNLLDARVTMEEVRMNSADAHDGEKQKAGFVDISTLDLYHLLQLFITILNEKAWRYIGLHVDPITSEIETDFERAHVAIDCIISLVDKLEPHLTKDETNRLRSLITDLQINYARQVERKEK